MQGDVVEGASVHPEKGKQYRVAVLRGGEEAEANGRTHFAAPRRGEVKMGSLGIGRSWCSRDAGRLGRREGAALARSPSCATAFPFRLLRVRSFVLSLALARASFVRVRFSRSLVVRSPLLPFLSLVDPTSGRIRSPKSAFLGSPLWTWGIATQAVRRGTGSSDGASLRHFR